MKTVGILNPSSPSSRPIQYDLITAWFNRQGFQVVYSNHLADKERFLAGTDANRAMDVNDFFKNPQIDLIVALKGGYGSPRILDKVNYALVRENPKPLFGFSDTTGLQLALWSQARLVTYTGLSPHRDITEKGADPLIEIGFQKRSVGARMSYALKPLYPSKAQGTFVGGTLALIDTLIGTPYAPDFRDTILFIEDVREEPYQIDRMLTHLYLAGVFNQIKGLVWGDFFECVSSDEADGSIEEVILDWSRQIYRQNPIPILVGLPYGHDVSRTVLPIGLVAEITAEGTLIV